ncbi:hypothetical protein Y1Q_0016657 [Alligator mississippiensis]|uniref:Uncharacterized protein n=1 Tax=Alligator mississippiensis TaxID=8496 RepID=A0A151P1W4_ALLMI|nr:hypothetical protein Y1Q_0016657 [Alligator mississippiensis]
MDLQQSPFTTLGSLGNEAGKAASDDAYSWIYPGFTVQTGLGDESSDLSTAFSLHSNRAVRISPGYMWHLVIHCLKCLLALYMERN